MIAAIGWPDGVAESPAAVPIQPCALPPLAFAKRAKAKKLDMTDALIGSVLAGMVSSKAKEPPAADAPAAEPTSWCREGAAGPIYATYRSGGTDSYVLALADAGRTISVAPGISLDDKQPPVAIYLNDLDRTLVYPGFDGLPRPDQVVAAVQKGSPISSTSRNGKDITIDAK
ncbi:hypothetical protein [Sphingomonas hengshuiensis]|uniref:Uncharacterized protein n=1 Tax=Sphingomonas hengshuiensis TaxID=1609977 RepID=A0A7U5HVN6_9SPHN|nr:hypothetical protein [Sphingomonas hengshuiensis]AJP74099.1 hypothetical protein TS85_23365 [Sphingomonas hengshuiensis]